MNIVSKETVQKLYDEKEQKAVKVSKFVKAIFYSTLFLTIISIIAVFAIDIPFFPTFFFILIIDFLLMSSMPYIAAFVASEKDYGIKKALKIGRFINKYAHLHGIKSREICSDAFLSQINMCMTTERKHFNRFSLLLSRFYTFILRNDAQMTYNDLAEAEKMFNPKENILTDMLYMRFNFVIHFGSTTDFYKLLDENPNIYEISNKNYQSMIAYISLVIYDRYVSGDLEGALEQLQVWIYFVEKDLGGKAQSPNLNINFYQHSSLYLDKARYLYELGKIDEAKEAMDTSDKIITKLTCDVPPYYTSEHKEIMNKLYPIEQNSAELD